MKPRIPHIAPVQADQKARRALLIALRAEKLVPQLIERLSRGRCHAGAEDPAMLRDWVASLQKDPGWPVIQAHLGQASAAGWPSVWSRACAAGWSARTDHHHALIFARFATRLAAVSDFEVARYCWAECVGAWLRVFERDYVEQWLETMGKTDLATRRHLLDPLVDARVEELRAGLGLIDAPQKLAASTKADSSIDRRLIRFAWEALDTLQKRIVAADLQDPALVGALERIDQNQKEIVTELMREFGRRVDRLDLSAPSKAAVLSPFQWVNDIFSILAVDAASAARVADAAVDVGWKLRKLQLDDIDDWMSRLLKTASRFNDALEGFIQAGQAFGHNSTCADFLVFRGEHRKRAAGREKYFERAIGVCPGHRNASMMLSYEKLRALSDLLLRVRMVPSAITRLPGTTERVSATLKDARALLDEAEALYPANEAILEYRNQLAHEASRFGAEV